MHTWYLTLNALHRSNTQLASCLYLLSTTGRECKRRAVCLSKDLDEIFRSRSRCVCHPLFRTKASQNCTPQRVTLSDIQHGTMQIKLKTIRRQFRRRTRRICEWCRRCRCDEIPAAGRWRWSRARLTMTVPWRPSGAELTSGATAGGQGRGVLNNGERAVWSGRGKNRLSRAGQNKDQVLAV